MPILYPRRRLKKSTLVVTLLLLTLTGLMAIAASKPAPAYATPGHDLGETWYLQIGTGTGGPGTGTGTAAYSYEQSYSGFRSVKLTTTTTDDWARIVFPGDPGITLSSVTKLSYWSLVTSAPGNDRLRPWVGIYLDDDGDGAWDYYIQAEPVYTISPEPGALPNHGTWEYWDAYDSTRPLRWVAYEVDPDLPYEAPTLQDYISGAAVNFLTANHGYQSFASREYGSLTVIKIAFMAGYGSTWANFIGYVDDVTINDFTQSFDCVIPPSGLVSWWPGDENPNDVVNGNNGLLQGGAAYWPNGKVAQAFNLDGSTGYVQGPNIPLWNLGTDDFTIDLWVDFNQVTLNYPFVAHDEGGGSLNKWIFWYTPTTGLTFHINSPALGSGVNVVTYPWTPSAGTWYHLAVTRSGNTYALYINGVQESISTDSNTIPAANAPLTIGRAEAFYFNGLLDEVEIFNRALSTTEIQAIYNAADAGKCKPVSMTVSYSIVGDGSPAAPPAFNYMQSGASKTYTLTTTPTSIQVDTSSSWSVMPNPLSGSTSSEQWYSADTLSGIASATTLAFTFYHYYYLTTSTNLGSVSPVSGWQNAGLTYTHFLTATAPAVADPTVERYVFDGWTGSGTGSYSGPDNPGSVTMNGPISETASWTHQFYLTVTTPDGGVGSNPNPVSGWFDSGTPITASVTSPVPGSPGYQYPCTGWTGSGSVPASGTTNSVTFTITAPSSITWNYKTQYFLTVESAYDTPGGEGWYDVGSTAYATLESGTVAGDAGVQYAFDVWTWDSSGSGLTSNPIPMDGPMKAIASWTTQYYLTMSTNFGDVSPGSGWYDVGSAVTITATAPAAGPGEQYAWNGWTGGGTGGSYTGLNNPANNAVTMSGPVSEAASWTRQFYLIVTSAYDSPDPVSGYFEYGTPITASVTSPVSGGTGIQYVCTGWSGGTGSVPTSGTTASTTFTITAYSSITWNWVTQYYLTVESAYDTPGGQGWYDSGSTAYATLASGTAPGGTGVQYAFDVWTWNSAGSGLTSNPIPMDGPMKAIALWKTQYLLTVATSGLSSSSYPTHVLLGGSSVGTAYDGSSYTQWFDATTSTGTIGVDRTVAGGTGTRFVFWHWGEDLSTANPRTAVTMTGPATYTADYRTQFRHTVTSSPVIGLGFVRVDGGAAQPTPYTTDWWPSGQSHTIEAVSPVSDGANTRYVWLSWSDGGAQLHSVSPTSPSTFTANYNTQYKLTVASDRDSPSPAVGDNWFDSGTPITAYVTSPADLSDGTRYRCTGWSGGTGNVPASGSGTSVSFTITAPSSITWNWQKQYRVTFDQTGVGGDFADTVLVVDGTRSFGVNGLPVSFWGDDGSVHSFAFQSPLVVAANVKQYVWTSTSGLSTQQSGSITVSSSGSVVGNYKTQFYLTMQVNPSGGGSTTPPSGWQDSGSPVTIRRLLRAVTPSRPGPVQVQAATRDQRTRRV